MIIRNCSLILGNYTGEGSGGAQQVAGDGPQGLARRRWPEPGGPQAGQGGYCGRPSAAITGLGSGFSIHL
jgi:hypothetical protein